MCQHELRGLLYFIIFILISIKYQANHDSVAFWIGLFFGFISAFETTTYFVKEIKK
jgi:hypothetical protein